MPIEDVDLSYFDRNHEMLYRANIILFHDVDTGVYRVLKNHSNVEPFDLVHNNVVINKRNKGVIIDLLTAYHG